MNATKADSQNSARFGSESTILEVFLKLVLVLVVLGLGLLTIMRFTGEAPLQPVERNFIVTPNVDEVQTDGTTNFSQPPQQQIQPTPSRPESPDRPPITPPGE